MTQLNTQSLAIAAQRGAAVPAYDRQSLTPSVVHIGLGAFHRAHQAMVFDALLSRGDRRWGVLGVAMRSTQLADALQTQHGLCAVQIASVKGIHWQIPGAIVDTCVLARENATVIQAIAAPSTRWITLTVTEKGYTPELAKLIVQGLTLRHRQGLSGLTIASCDNLSHNGKRLQAACVTAAQAVPAALATWVDQVCVFPNSMVDRIVPAATPERLQAARDSLGVDDAAALGTEGFWEWVIEDRFVDPSDGPALASAGVTVVPTFSLNRKVKVTLPVAVMPAALLLMVTAGGVESTGVGSVPPLGLEPPPPQAARRRPAATDGAVRLNGVNATPRRVPARRPTAQATWPYR